jgi:L-lactate dehydrogenase complex protein LldF
MSVRVGEAAGAPAFPVAAKRLMRNEQLRRNVRNATGIIRGKRAKMVGEMADWEQLREAGHAIKEHTLRHLGEYLVRFEENCARAGGIVHWARDADEANTIAIGIIQAKNETEVIKVKTMTTDEIGMNKALEAAGIMPYETDLADLIVQLGEDKPSHIVVPALHRNKMEIRELFMRTMGLAELGTRPEDIAEAARVYLREKFLRVPIAISGANFAVAETGSICVVESEGNGRMCVSLPRVLISVVGIEKIIPKFEDLEVFLQLLSRSATGERMNPYNSIWTGVAPGDGPEEFHVILLDNGRTRVLADSVSRETLDCIRCGACLNACPVYRQTGGHAYGSIYAGPIGAILTPQLQSMEHSQTLPYASSLCGACYEVCPVKINIPEILIHLRNKLVEAGDVPAGERLGMKAAAWALSDAANLSTARTLGRIAQMPFTNNGAIHRLPGTMAGWTATRDMPAIPAESFRQWWARRQREKRP